jgi:hypothetical protein
MNHIFFENVLHSVGDNWPPTISSENEEDEENNRSFWNVEVTRGLNPHYIYVTNFVSMYPLR